MPALEILDHGGARKFCQPRRALRLLQPAFMRDFAFENGIHHPPTSEARRPQKAALAQIARNEFVVAIETYA